MLGQATKSWGNQVLMQPFWAGLGWGYGDRGKDRPTGYRFVETAFQGGGCKLLPGRWAGLGLAILGIRERLYLLVLLSFVNHA